MRRAFPTADSVRDYLFHEDEPVRRLLARDWLRRRLNGEDPGWALWTRPTGDPRQVASTHKLYVSPDLDSIRPALHGVLAVITDSEAVGFKIGAELPYLSRSDKLVVYFSSYAETARVARVLGRRLRGVRAHGVPFTCALDQRGLLSWGMDPPESSQRQHSWRLWLAEHMAAAMVEAPGGKRIEAAIARAESLGIDPVSWEPRAVVWGAR